MSRLLPKLLLLMLSAMAAMPGHAETDIAGYWQHESDPVWIEMKPETGQGVMLRNDNRPCLLYTSPSPRDRTRSRMPSSA